MKKFLVILLAAVMVLPLVSCGGGNNALKDFAGTYKGVKLKMVGDETLINEEFSLELKADGTGVHHRDGSEFSFTWTLDGENFKMTEKFLGATIEYSGTLKDGTLDIFNGDKTDDFTYEYVYEKQ